MTVDCLVKTTLPGLKSRYEQFFNVKFVNEGGNYSLVTSDNQPLFFTGVDPSAIIQKSIIHGHSRVDGVHMPFVGAVESKNLEGEAGKRFATKFTKGTEPNYGKENPEEAFSSEWKFLPLSKPGFAVDLGVRITINPSELCRKGGDLKHPDPIEKIELLCR